MIRTSVFAIALIVSASSPDTAVVESSTATSGVPAARNVGGGVDAGVSATHIVRGGMEVTWTGWFSDKGCAASKIKSGNISPNGTECVKKCLTNGETPVFISEQAKAMYDVK